MKIYLDIFFLVNILMNYAILTMLGLIRRKSIFQLGIFIAALAGGACSVAFLIFGFGRYMISFLMMYGPVAGILLRIAFGKVNIKEGILNIFLFYVLGFFMAGFLMMVSGMFGGTKLSMIKLLSVVIFALFLIGKIVPYFLNSFRHYSHYYELEICYRGKWISGTGFLDTGNQLFEPISRRPVLVMEKKLMETLLEQWELEYLENFRKGNTQGNEMPVRLIPYQSVGTNKGCLMGVRAEKLRICMNGKWKEVKMPWVGLCEEAISRTGEYEMLLHEEFISSAI